MIEKNMRNSRPVSSRLGIALSVSFISVALLGGGILVPTTAHSQPKPGTTKQARALSAQSQRSLELNEQGVTAIKARDFARAESLFTEALNVDSKNITAVFNLAGMYITNKKEGQAVSLLQKYTREFPKDAGLHARLGDAYFGSQDPKNAIASYEKALQLDPKNPSIPVRLATLYAMNKKIDKAAQMYEQALKYNPRDTQSLQNLSSIYLALNKPQQAIATAKKALQITATPDLYITLGNAYQDLKDPRNALISFQRARELGHKDPNLSKVIEDLARATSESNRT